MSLLRKTQYFVYRNVILNGGTKCCTKIVTVNMKTLIFSLLCFSDGEKNKQYLFFPLKISTFFSFQIYIAHCRFRTNISLNPLSSYCVIIVIMNLVSRIVSYRIVLYCEVPRCSHPYKWLFNVFTSLHNPDCELQIPPPFHPIVTKIHQ